MLHGRNPTPHRSEVVGTVTSFLVSVSGDGACVSFVVLLPHHLTATRGIPQLIQEVNRSHLGVHVPAAMASLHPPSTVRRASASIVSLVNPRVSDLSIRNHLLSVL
jgi:hypothetical protein